MTKTYLPQPQLDGSVGVRVSEPLLNGEGDKIVNRYVLTPGQFTDAATFVATDLSKEPANIKAVCEAQWTPAIVAAWKVNHPWVPPTPKSDEQVRDETFKADAARVSMVQRLRTATPAQIDTYIDANVTNLAEARTFLKGLTKVLATVVRD